MQGKLSFIVVCFDSMSCFMRNFIHKYDAYSFFNLYTFENDRKYDLINETMDIMNKRFLFILFAKWLLCFVS